MGITIQQARALQDEIRRRVRVEGRVKTPDFVAACDVAYQKGGNSMVACAVLWDIHRAEAVRVNFAEGVVDFQYVPGLLAFRESSLMLEALRGLEIKPDVIMVDGHGIAHPQEAGLACHVGLDMGVPTLGCAKNLLVGTHGPIPPEKGAYSWLLHQGKVVGAAIRSRRGARPVYASPGHLIDVPNTLKVVLHCLGRYRVPEPLRQAHLHAQARVR
jgi:deoxyribonuclease V